METTPSSHQTPITSAPESLTTQELRELVTALQDLRIENRDIQEKLLAVQAQGAVDQRHRVIANSRASLHLLPPTPFPSPLAPPSRPSNPLFVRRLTVAEKLQTPRTPAPASRAIGLPNVEDEELLNPTSNDVATDPEQKHMQMPQRTSPWSTNDKGLALLVKKLEPPPTYTGDTQKDKISDLRQWVARADDYMDIHMGEGMEGGRLQVVIQWTGGAAKDYLKQKKKELDLLYEQGQLTYPAEWVEIKHNFINAFEGEQYRMLQRVELEALRLGHGKCRTPMMLNAEFERLASRLWPSGTDLASFDHVLGDEYGKIIERSDLNLWRDIYRGGMLWATGGIVSFEGGTVPAGDHMSEVAHPGFSSGGKASHVLLTCSGAHLQCTACHPCQADVLGVVTDCVAAVVQGNTQSSSRHVQRCTHSLEYQQLLYPYLDAPTC